MIQFRQALLYSTELILQFYNEAPEVWRDTERQLSFSLTTCMLEGGWTLDSSKDSLLADAGAK